MGACSRQQRSITHPRRTDCFAAAAAQAVVQMKVASHRRSRESGLPGFCQGDPAPGRFSFDRVERIGRAGWQAQAALHAVVGQRLQGYGGVGSAGWGDGHTGYLPGRRLISRGDTGGQVTLPVSLGQATCGVPPGRLSSRFFVAPHLRFHDDNARRNSLGTPFIGTLRLNQSDQVPLTRAPP